MTVFQRHMMKTSRPQIHSQDSAGLGVRVEAMVGGNKYKAWVAGMWGGSVVGSWGARLRSLISTDCLERSSGEIQDYRKPCG